jgi:predicted O-methyltransferase YrrM
MNLDNALKIPGWMEPPELTWLAEQAATHTRILEVGSFLGRSTRALADNTPGIVFSVDLWNFTPELVKAYLANGGGSGVFSSYRQHLADVIGSKVIPILMPSVSASQIFPTPIFDMIFIDGAHDFYSVLADIACWAKCLTAGGLLCGHDLDWESVNAAVSSLAPKAHNVPDTSIWYTTLDRPVIIPDSERLPNS